MNNKKKEPDLQIVRNCNPVLTEGLEFYKDDECLEIHGWNCDSDSFIIILSPDEISRLKKLLEEL